MYMFNIRTSFLMDDASLDAVHSPPCNMSLLAAPFRSQLQHVPVASSVREHGVCISQSYAISCLLPSAIFNGFDTRDHLGRGGGGARDLKVVLGAVSDFRVLIEGLDMTPCHHSQSCSTLHSSPALRPNCISPQS